MISLVMFKPYLSTLWQKFKPHAVPVVLTVLLGVCLYFVFMKKDQDMSELLKKQDQIHAQEIKKIEEAQAIERQAREENAKQFSQALTDVQNKYDLKIRALEKRRVTRIRKLVKQFDRDPKGVAKQVSELTGFRLMLPSDKK